MKWFVVGSCVLLVGIGLWLRGASVDSVGAGELVRSPEEAERGRLVRPAEIGITDRRRTRDQAAGRAEGEYAEPEDFPDELAGVVLDPEGRPVPDARILVAVDASGRLAALPGRATTDGRGRFAFPLRAGIEEELVVLARSSSWAPGSRRTSERSVEVELSRGLRVHGKVVNFVGEPLPGAVVTVRPWSLVEWAEVEDLDERRMQVGADGRFELAGLCPAILIATASLEGYADLRDVRSEVAAHAEPWELRLMPGADLVGRVTAPDGVPAPGIPLDFEAEDETRHARTGGDGTFRFEAVPVGPAVLAWEPEAWSAGFQTVDVPTNGPVEIVLAAPAGLRGRVWTPAGEAYSVSLESPDGDLSERFETAEFVLGGVPAGSYSVGVEPDGGTFRHVGTVHLTPGVTVDLGTVSIGRGTTAFGRAEFTAGRPAEGRCRLDRFTAKRIAWEQVSTTPLESGRFEFTGLEPGRYRVTIEPEGGLPTSPEPRFLVTGTDVDFGLVLCTTARAVEVSLIGTDGAPAVRRSVHLSSHRTAYASETDATGSCFFDEVDPGDASVFVRVADGYRTVPIEVSETGDTRVTIDLRELKPGSPWHGRLLGPDGPLAQCSIRLTALDYSWMTPDGTTAADGTFELTGLHEGSALLSVYVPSIQASLRELVPDAPRPTELTLRFGRLEGRLRGRASEALPVKIDRLEWSDSGVPELERAGRPYSERATDESGSFEFRALPIGSYRVSIQLPQGRSIEREVEVRAGTQRLEIDLE